VKERAKKQRRKKAVEQMRHNYAEARRILSEWPKPKERSWSK